jgi:hypothetical protein
VFRQFSGGPPQSIVGLVITSQVRNAKDTFEDDLAVEFTDAPNGQYTATKFDTTAWPLGRSLNWDIKYVDGQTVIHTDTIILEIIKQATE